MGPVTNDLKDRVAVITGGARGMGKAYVQAFLSAGAKVVATDRSWSGVEEFREELKGHDTNVLLADMDVTEDAQIDQTYQAALDKFKTVDILVNNAAMRSRDLFPPKGRATTLETKDSDWEKLFKVNLFGALKVIRRFIQPMIEKRKGSIISVVSSGILNHSRGGGYVALRPNSMEMPYMSSKAALATLSFYLADEVKRFNVAVNIIIPGHTRTTGFDEQNRARLEAGAKPGPLPVIPEHVTPLVLHLASQDATGITGRMFDAMQWNIEHGLGGQEQWADKSFSYQRLMSR
ncbi:MAG TPA: SDR family NAD(P)-dependent oxidoreductase [Candidatus Binatia bacterium]|nr:SDR family NAD(P)-dependent oxidoreductase [Candidatus Binatia bacterium]